MQTGPLILCLDENETALRVRRLVLEQAGYRVLFATELAEGFYFFAADPVELVITEYLLRDGPAADVILRMKQLKPKVPIMLLSGAIEWPELRDVDMFVSKLEPTEDVLKTIAFLIGGRSVELPRAA
jgi:CheY-like chemotaxis protein